MDERDTTKPVSPAERVRGTRWVLLQTAPWDHVMSLPGHHLARYLAARGARVAYLSAPVSPWHFLESRSRELAKRRWHMYGPAGREVQEKIFAYIPRTLLPVHHRWPFDTSLSRKGWARFSFPNVRKVLRHAGFRHPDVLLVQNLQFPGLGHLIKPKFTVYTVEDDLEHFPRMPRCLPRFERRLVPRADLVTATARPLLDKMCRLGARDPYALPNGVDWELYRRPDSQPAPAGERPCAIYVGALDVWFDEQMLAEVAQRLPHWDFCLYGPPRRPFAALRNLPNVQFPGPVPREQVPPLLWQATAGIIPFQRTPLTDSVCPLKLFEYLAAGLPTVSARMTEMENLASPAALCATAEEWVTALEASRRIDDAGRAGLADYAKGFRWESLFDGLVEQIMARGGL